MFKSARWRSDKNKDKVKAVFKLQFHATQVSQLGADSLTVSIIPVDIGKPSVKLEKASVQDGGCRWESPVYETVKFFRDTRTGKIDEKIYRFSVANGSAKNGILGEVSIDFAAYAEANKASTVSLPLRNSNSDAILHVLIQRIQGYGDQREVEECDDTKPKSDRSLRTHLSNGNLDEMLAIDGPNTKTAHNGELNGNHRASSGSDLTFSSSDSSSGVNTPREVGLRNGDVHQEPSTANLSLNNSSVPQRKAANALVSDEEHRRSQWEWSGGSDHGVSGDDSAQISHKTLARENSQQALETEVERLKAELLVLSRQADMSELELQTLRKQIVKESKRGCDLSKEVISLKEEREAYKSESERLKSFQRRSDDAKANGKLSLEGGDLRTHVEEIRQELNHEKDLNSNLRLQLQKTQEANSELILAIQDLEEMLEQKNNEIADQPNQSRSGNDVAWPTDDVRICETDEDEEQKALEKIVKEYSTASQTTMLEQKIIDLQNEIEIYRRDRDEFEMQMEQLALDYEILKQENHDVTYKLEQSQLQEQLKIQYECTPRSELGSQIGILEKELKIRSEEFSDSLVTIRELESHITSLEEELKMQSKESSNLLGTITELKSHIESLDDELKTRSKESEDYLATIEELQSQVRNLNEELKLRSKESSESLVTIEELKSHVKSLDGDLKTQSKESSESLATIQELESHIEGLDKELKKRSKESSDYFVTIKELESHIKSLEEELEEQAHGFEVDLEALMVAKVEQEQRAIRAEDSLRKMRWKNANTAEKLQEEFRRLSMQMSSTFEANEKVAAKAMQEASELRSRKMFLEEKLQKAKGELQVLKEEYEAKLLSLSNQIGDKTNQLECISANAKKLELLHNHDEKIRKELSMEISELKAEGERLKTENRCTYDKDEQKSSLIAELEKLKVSAKENEILIEKGNAERNSLMDSIAFVKKEAEESMKELARMKNIKDDNEATIEFLRSELEKLKSNCDALKNSLVEDEVEKEKLRKQVFQLKGDLKKKDDTITTIEKKLKENNGRTTIPDGNRIAPKNNKTATAVHRGSKEVTSLREKIKLLEGQIRSKEAALETSANSFLEKEKDLQNKIEELESCVDELNHSSSFQKVVKDASTLTSNDGITADENHSEVSLPKREEKQETEGHKSATHEHINGNLEDLSTELASLKEKNEFMESELKEMQERYSEISLKFAEVEGERQKLVMNVRYLKNNRKH